MKTREIEMFINFLRAAAFATNHTLMNRDYSLEPGS